MSRQVFELQDTLAMLAFYKEHKNTACNKCVSFRMLREFTYNQKEKNCLAVMFMQVCFVHTNGIFIVCQIM